MRIALPWHSREERQFGDEYNITFINKPNNFDNLMEFLSTHKEDRFNIFIDESEYSFDYAKLKILNSLHPQIYIVTSLYQKYWEYLKENNIKFFFSSDCLISNFRELDYVCSIGVTDVYIQDDLCYELKKVRKTVDRYGVNVRLILNQIASSMPDKATNVRSPWFIPETVDELSKYIDTVEFKENSWVKIETLYKIWFKKKQWRENVQAINPQLKIPIWNQSMIPDFTIYKMNCGYRCAYGSACKKCNQFTEMAQDLYDKHIEYVIKRDKEI